MILVVTIVYNATQSAVYLDVDNFVNLFRLSIEKVIIAVIMTFVIINGEIDLSVASVMAFSACTLAAAHERGRAVRARRSSIALFAGATAGFLQGAVVARTGISSLVVTLAGLIGFRGAARILLEDRSDRRLPRLVRRRRYQTTSSARCHLRSCSFARASSLSPASSSTARRSVARCSSSATTPMSPATRASTWSGSRSSLFTTSGLVAGVAGVLFAARLGSVRANVGEGFELDIITMVLLGGVSIFGGSGHAWSASALAICIVLNLRNGLGLANVEANTQTGIIGALLIVSVLVQNLARSPADSSPRGGHMISSSSQPARRGQTRPSSGGPRGREGEKG